MNGRLRGSGDASAANGSAKMQKAGQAKKDAPTAGLLSLLTEAMQVTESRCGAGVNSGRSRVLQAV